MSEKRKNGGFPIMGGGKSTGKSATKRLRAVTAAGAKTAARRPGPKWPSFRGKAALVGTSPSKRVTIYVDKALGQAGMKNAKDLLADADRVVQANDHFFGTSSGSVNVIVFALTRRTHG